MRRGESIFELDPQTQDTIEGGIEMEGSNLSGVSSRCSWEDYRRHLESEENKENRRKSDRPSSRDSLRKRISDYGLYFSSIFKICSTHFSNESLAFL